MKKTLIVLSLCCSVVANVYSQQWKPAGDKIKTTWASKIDPSNVLPEYPRPILERNDWMNLNGLWKYSILPFGQSMPLKYDGDILVPFPVESSLSGVQKEVGKNKEVWYNRSFDIPSKWNGKNILLHFGAVDWKADVYLNDIKIGSHTGGFTPFSFDITPYLKSGSQELVVKVWDPTDEGSQPRGKQVRKPEGIWYTPVTGIWQTVWLEPVNNKYISNVKSIPDIDNTSVAINVGTENTSKADIIEVIVKDGQSVVSKQKAAASECLNLHINKAKLWTPETPFLYDLEINLYENGELVDQAKSYTAMRKISKKRDANGIVRMQLNNKDYFHFGPLDQGWWPDGLYTAPTDEALLFDIQRTKDLGFNMIRKHIKVEPARWYTYCDRIGLLVWQDMPSGDKNHEWQNKSYFSGNELFRTSESEATYRKEWKEIMDNLAPYPSIVMWVPFNEAWGQFKTQEISEWTKAYDSSRLVNSASGGNFFATGDVLDLHNYPGPEMYLFDGQRVNVLGEYGGIGFPLKDHLWQPDKNWGYIQFKNSDEVTNEYIKYAEELKKLITAGFSGAVYTQTTDVEGEVNGFLTYDRKVMKMDETKVRKVNIEICNSLTK